MPWTSKDAPKKLDSIQKKKWAEIANAIYKECMKSGDDKTCAPKAKRIANSKFTQEVKMKAEIKKEKMPLGALQFVDKTGFAMAGGSEDEPKLEMTMYTGKVISSHWWWGNLVIDLDGMSFPKSKYPILENHMSDRKIAFGGKPIKDNYTLKAAQDVKFVDTEESAEFQKLSKEGFPYEASIYAQPTRVQRIDEDEEAEVNGFTFKGPGVIWRKSVYKEASVCVFGWDSKTSAKAFSTEIELSIEEEVKIDESIHIETINKKGGEKKMTFDELKQDTELYNAMKAEVKAEMKVETGKVEGRVADLESKLAERDVRVSALEKENEKREAMRIEAERMSKAKGIVASKLSDSKVPERLYGKISNLIDYSQFMKDENAEAFSAQVDAEIKDWEGLEFTPSIGGLSATTKTDVKTVNEDTEDETRANNLFAFVK